jgi:hypothetical protein
MAKTPLTEEATKATGVGEQPEQFAANTVTSASVGTLLKSGSGTITAFTMNQPTSAQVDDMTPLTLVDPTTLAVGTVAIAAGGTTGVSGSAVYQVSGGTGTPAQFNVTVAGGAITAIGSPVNPGNYTVFPTSPAALTYVSGAGSGVAGATVNLTPIPNGPARTIYSANMRALACEYEPRPGMPLTPALTAPTWPKNIAGPAATSIPFTNGCFVQSCPANTTFTVTC